MCLPFVPEPPRGPRVGLLLVRNWSDTPSHNRTWWICHNFPKLASHRCSLATGVGNKLVTAGFKAQFPAGLAKVQQHVSAFWMSLGLVIAALLSSVATFLILNGLVTSIIIPTNDVVLWTLGINAAFVVAIIGIIGFQVAKLLKARKRQAGAGLHFRIAGVFSLVALFPAVLLAIFATVSIDRTFDTFFSTRVKSIVSNSVEVAQSYMQESGQTIRSDIVGRQPRGGREGRAVPGGQAGVRPLLLGRRRAARRARRLHHRTRRAIFSRLPRKALPIVLRLSRT